MRNLLVLIFLTFIFALPTDSGSVSSLEIDPKEHLPRTLSKEEWDQFRPFIMRKFKDFLNEQAEKSEKVAGEIPSTIWVKKHTNPDTIVKEVNPSLGTLPEKVPASHLSIVVPNRSPERTVSKDIEQPDLQSIKQVETRVDDEVMKSVLDEYKGKGQFKYDWKNWNDKLPDSAFTKLRESRKRPASQNWDFFLQLLEADREKKDPYNPPYVKTVVRSVPRNSQNPKNTEGFGKVSPVDDEMMKNILDNHQDHDHLNFDSESNSSPHLLKNWDGIVPGNELSVVSPVSLRDIPQMTMSNEEEEFIKQILENYVSNEDWDHYLQHLESDFETHSSVPSNSQHVLEGQTALRSVPNHLRIRKAGEMGKSISEESSLSIGKELASNTKNIITKLPRIL